jgi:flagellar protein FliO/FliZ
MSAAAQPAAALSVGSLLQVTFSLLLILGLIFASSWVLKRFKVAGFRSGGGGMLAIVDQIALGPRERIVLVRVGRAQVLVGVGAAGLVPLTPLASPIEAALPDAAGPAAPPPFAERLREFLKRPGDSP